MENVAMTRPIVVFCPMSAVDARACLKLGPGPPAFDGQQCKSRISARLCATGRIGAARLTAASLVIGALGFGRER